MEKDLSSNAMIITTLMEMDAAAIVKYRLAMSVREAPLIQKTHAHFTNLLK